jgi:fucose permease
MKPIETRVPEHTRRRIDGLSISLVFAVLGGTIAIWGATIDTLSAAYGVGPDRIGIFVSVMSIGRMASVFLSGLLSDAIGFRRTIVLGIVLLIQSLVAVALEVPFAVLYPCMFASGIGHGMIDTAGVAGIAETYGTKSESAINNIQLFYGAGALAAPLIVFLSLSRMNWQAAYVLLATTGLIPLIALVAGMNKSDRPRSSDEPSGTLRSAQAVFARTVLSLEAVCVVLYSGIGVVIATWFPLYVRQFTDAPNIHTMGLALYSVGLTIGALCCRIATRVIGARTLLGVAACSALVAGTIVVLVDSAVGKMAGISLVGVSLGGIYSLSVGLRMMQNINRSGAISGIMATLAALGAMVFSAVSSVLVRTANVSSVFRMNLILFALLSLCGLLLLRTRR